MLTSACAGLVWATWAFPSQDGPSHSYNAWILLQYGLDTSVYSQFYDVSLQPTTNWLGGILLTALGQLAPMPIAEKILITLSLILFVSGGAMLLREDRDDLPPVALILPALAFNYPLHMGFFSFCLGFALVPWAWALAGRSIRSSGWQVPLALGMVVLMAYLAHLVAALMALAGVFVIGVSSVLRERRLRRFRYGFLAVLPTLGLLASYLSRMPKDSAVFWEMDTLIENVITLRSIASYIGAQEWIAMGIGASVLIVVLYQAWNRTPGQRLWWVLAALGVGLYMVLPNGSQGHWFLSDRLSLLPWLALLPLCHVVRARNLQIAVFGGLCAAFLVTAGIHQTPLDKELQALDSLASHVEPDSLMVSLSFRRRAPAPARARVFLHAADRIAVARNAVDIGNYEAQTNHFQTRIKPTVRWPNYNHLEGAAEQVNPEMLFGSARYVLTVDLDTHAPDYRGQLETFYGEVSHSGRFRLFKRHAQRLDAPPPSPDEPSETGSAPPETK
jgi:hypothetical protein